MVVADISPAPPQQQWLAKCPKSTSSSSPRLHPPTHRRAPRQMARHHSAPTHRPSERIPTRIPRPSTTWQRFPIRPVRPDPSRSPHPSAGPCHNSGRKQQRKWAVKVECRSSSVRVEAGRAWLINVRICLRMLARVRDWRRTRARIACWDFWAGRRAGIAVPSPRRRAC